MTFELGRLAQVIHVTDDLASARHLYGDVLGGESYYEGYSPFEKRDASIFAIGDLTIEPMSPSDEPDAMQYPVGRFLARFGPRLHSIAVNATGVPDLARHLVDAGIRVVGPGGVPVSEMAADGPVSIYTHPRDSHVLIEFVDFGAELMPSSPRLAPEWDASRRAAEHPAGVLGPSHATVVVSDVDAALGLFTGVLGCPPVGDAVRSEAARTTRVRLGHEMVVELWQPLDPSSDEGEALASDGEGLYSLTISVVDLERASTYLRSRGIETSTTPTGELALDRRSTAGARLLLAAASSSRP